MEMQTFSEPRMNPALPLIRKVVQTTDMQEVEEKLQSGSWIAVWCARTKVDGEVAYKFALGRVC